MAETWTVLKILQWTSDYFAKKSIDSARLTAELLLAEVLHLSRVQLYMQFDRPLEKAELATYRALIERRAAGEPTAYLTGSREFYGRAFKVDARVLVPRPETERLVEQVLEFLPADSAAEVLDLCTGSCCIGATLAAERPQLRVTATDLSEDALAVARSNVDALGLSERVTLLHGDLLAPVEGRVFAAIVSNPPYIAADALSGLSREVQREPRMALTPGPLGTELLARIIGGAAAHLEPGGLLALEIGDDQKAQARDLLSKAGYREVRVLADWAGRDRVALGTRG